MEEKWTNYVQCKKKKAGLISKMESLLHVLFTRHQALQFQELVSQGGGG